MFSVLLFQPLLAREKVRKIAQEMELSGKLLLLLLKTWQNLRKSCNARRVNRENCTSFWSFWFSQEKRWSKSGQSRSATKSSENPNLVSPKGFFSNQVSFNLEALSLGKESESCDRQLAICWSEDNWITLTFAKSIFSKERWHETQSKMDPSSNWQP